MDSARFEFENAIFETGLDHLNFHGPVQTKQIEDFEADPEYVVFYWWAKSKNDTLRVYAKVDKELKKQTSIHFSKNIEELYNELTD